MMSDKSLKFGVMLSGTILKQWQADAIERLTERGHQWAFAVMPESEAITAETSGLKKYLGRHALYHFYLKWVHHPPLMKNISIAGRLRQVPIIKVKPIPKGKYRQTFDKEDVRKIKAENPDFILRFGFNIIEGEILQAARYGVWSFHHDDEEVIRGGPPGFWEIYHGLHSNGILLQRLTDELDAGIPIIKGRYKVIHHSYSTHLNELLREGINLLEFAVKRLEKGYFPPEKTNSGKKGKLYRFPQNGPMLRFLILLIINRIKFNLKDLFRNEQWNTGVINAHPDYLLQNKPLPSPNFAPGRGRRYFAADCFAAPAGDHLAVVFEDFDYLTFKGRISRYDYSPATGQWKDGGVLLEEKHHLAFPHIFEAEGRRWLMPEAAGSGRLAALPLDENLNIAGEPVTLMEGPWVDSVLFFHNGFYWILATGKEYGTNTCLFAWYSGTFKGPYREHLLNPVVIDAGRARMGGGMITAGSRLIRPAQKNNRYYGEKLIINEITKLSPTEFEEIKIGEITAGSWAPYNKGVHTLHFAGGKAVVDAKRNIFVPCEFRRKLKNKIRGHD